MAGDAWPPPLALAALPLKEDLAGETPSGVDGALIRFPPADPSRAAAAAATAPDEGLSKKSRDERSEGARDGGPSPLPCIFG